MFVFPQRTLAPGECVLVFADSTYADGADGYHAPFSLKAAGDTLMLFNPAGVAVEAINIPALAQNTVYRRVDGGWEVSAQYTPGMENTEESYQAMTLRHHAFGRGGERGHVRQHAHAGRRGRAVL